MLDELRRVALFSSGVAELTRHQAERIVKDFVKSGEVRRQQASSTVKDLLETSKVARTELIRLVRSEIQNQIAGLGLVTKRDLERLERRITRLESSSRKKTTARSGSSAATRAKSTDAKSSTAAKKSSASSARNPARKTST